ncbi:MAG: peptidoglycan DD-metalloendopeptidase family protein, partial [Elusimicrobia bacterium]|nr:peptidoglycan DD-metalloendopeptidase family protein [Elusimicrobiota bacterium]
GSQGQNARQDNNSSRQSRPAQSPPQTAPPQPNQTNFDFHIVIPDSFFDSPAGGQDQTLQIHQQLGQQMDGAQANPSSQAMAPYLSNPSSQIMPAGPAADQQQIPFPHITLGPLFHPIQEQAGNALPWNPDRDVSVVYVDNGQAMVNPRALDQDLLPVTPEDVAVRDRATNSPSHLVTLSNGSQALRITTLSGESRDNDTRIHQHVDIGVPAGTPVRTPRDGMIVNQDYERHAGHYITVLYEDVDYYYFTVYEHTYDDSNKSNDVFPVQVGDEVQAGQEIALSGNSGGMDPHLDYGLYRVPKQARSVDEWQRMVEERDARYRSGRQTVRNAQKLTDLEINLIKTIEEFKSGQADRTEAGGTIYSFLHNFQQDSPRLQARSRFYAVNPLDPNNWPAENSRNPGSMSGQW